MEFIEVARVEELKVGRVKRCVVNDRALALVHTRDGFFALDNTCPHRGGPLSEGDVIANEIVCPWHLWGFDAATGVCAGNPDIRIQTHELRIEDDRILVKLTSVAVTGP
jgi:nitrite reductase (NADH) small subunit